MELLLHPTTKKQIDLFLQKPPHALLILGPEGSGRGALAQHIAHNLLKVSSSALKNYPYLRTITPSGTSISIDSIRSLQEFTRLKTPGNDPIRRVVIVEDAGSMTTEAQNSFLKLLEEPPADTVLLLTAKTRRDLLPTVVSRTQSLNIRQPGKEDIEKYFQQQNYSIASIEKAFYISEGHLGLMSAILANDTGHPLVSAITEAKDLLAQPAFKRLARVDELSKQKGSSPDLLQGMQRVCRAALTQAINKDKLADAQHWQKALSRIIAAQAALSRSAQPKLLLTDLLMNV
jgi:replication-associated recombination protein RarA